MVSPFYLDFTESEIADIQAKTGEILRSGDLILGKYTEQFEQEFARYIGADYAVSLNSGTSALQVLLTLKGARGHKVAVPTNSNFACVAAILHSGATPVYLDMSAETFMPNLDILQGTLARHPDLAGVMWVHIGGMIAPDFEAVVAFCREKGLFLIEDCAHAHGSQLNATKAGNFADGGAFSFFPTKVMTTLEGGMITTNRKEDAALIKSYRNQGKRGGNYGGLHQDLGSSWRLSEIEAYIGLVQLAKLDTLIARRRKAVDALIPVLQERKIDFCDIRHMEQASLYKFIVRCKNTCSLAEIKEKFRQHDVALGGGVYEVPCHLQPVFEEVHYEPEEVKVAHKFCPRHICPPITSGTTEADMQKIIAAITRHVC
ncbi:MAG: DegT/DnrJ/EryC1/StrS family aminotransferase [bacterium]